MSACHPWFVIIIYAVILNKIPRYTLRFLCALFDWIEMQVVDVYPLTLHHHPFNPLIPNVDGLFTAVIAAAAVAASVAAAAYHHRNFNTFNSI